VEATPQQVISTGAAGAAYTADGVDGERGWRPAGSGGHREVPWWTTEKARIYSVAAYRSNPMARAIIDTYVAFCVGDVGVAYQATNPQVAVVVDQFWNDPRVQLGVLQERLLRDHLLMGETALELLVGRMSGVVRFSPAPVSAISDVRLLGGNPLWPDALVFGSGAGRDPLALQVAAVDDTTGLRDGQVMWWRSWQALLDDVRGDPFLTPILDHLDSYDGVISNLIDRTALARYLVWDVTVDGSQDDVDQFVAARGGVHVPPSGSVEVHNHKVTWEPKTASTGAEEDSIAGKNVLTLVAGGAGLAKTWLAEPDGANRATSLTMAEPVRRRVGGVQKLWLAYQTDLVRFAVDRAVAARRLPQMVTARDPRTGAEFDIPAAQSVTVTGPSVSASDAEFTAKILLNLSTGLEKMVKAGVLSQEAAAIAARKAWEDYVGVPYTADLDAPDADPADVAQVVDDAQEGRSGRFVAAAGFDPHQPRDGDGKWSKTPGAPGLPTTPGGLPKRRRVTEPPAPVTDLGGMLQVDLDHAVNRTMLLKVLNRVFDGEYAGLVAEVQDVERYDYFGSSGNSSGIRVRGLVFDESTGDGGREAGLWERAYYRDHRGKLIAVHAYLSLENGYQGRGFAAAFNANLERWYREQGVERIDLHANIDVGGYAWARAGYDFLDDESASDVLDRLRAEVQELTGEAESMMRNARASTGAAAEDLRRYAAVLDAQIEEAKGILERAEYEQFGSADFPTPYEISQCGRTAVGDGEQWIGKTTMLGSDWEATKWL
jgi:hypothetical protein